MLMNCQIMSCSSLFVLSVLIDVFALVAGVGDSVDTGMCILSIDMLTKHSEIRWDQDKHAADGEFLEAACRAYPQTISRVHVVAAYHNGVTITDNDHSITVEHSDHDHVDSVA